MNFIQLLPIMKDYSLIFATVNDVKAWLFAVCQLLARMATGSENHRAARGLRGARPVSGRKQGLVNGGGLLTVARRLQGDRPLPPRV